LIQIIFFDVIRPSGPRENRADAHIQVNFIVDKSMKNGGIVPETAMDGLVSANPKVLCTDIKGYVTVDSRSQSKPTVMRDRVSPDRMSSNVFDQMAEAILVIDFDGIILAANRSAAEFFGYSVDALCGSRSRRLRGPSYTDSQRARIHERIKAGKTWRGRVEFIKRDGLAGFHETEVSPFRNDRGEIVGLISSSRDVSLDVFLEEQSDLILEAVRSSNFGVTIADATLPALPLQYVNSAFEDITGYSFAEIKGQNCRFLQGPDTDPDAVSDIRRAISREEPITTMLLNYRKDGTRFWNRLQLSPIHDAEKRLRAYMSVQIDITRDVSERTIERERQKMEQLGKLASGISHELNNALQPILLMSGQLDALLQDGAGDERVCADSILEHATYAKEIVERILLFSRHGQLKKTKVPLAESLSNVVQFAREALPDSVAFDVQIDDSIASATAEFNATELMQVFTNLILNATQAMNGTGEIKIAANRVELTENAASVVGLRSGSFAQIDVIDNGSGIPESDISRIFDPYFTTKRLGEGTGLGLSIAYGIARDWGGTIAVSNEAAGARFSVFIPSSAH